MDEDTGICLLMVTRCQARLVYRSGTDYVLIAVLITSTSEIGRD